MNSITDKNVHNPDIFQVDSEYFRDFLRKCSSAENTIGSYLMSVRHYHFLLCDITVGHLQEYKAWLMEYCKPCTVNTRVYGINQYVITLQAAFAEEDMGPAHEESPLFVLPKTLSLLASYKPLSVRHQQEPSPNNVISKCDYEHLERCLKRDNNMFWYFVVHFPGAAGAGVSELIQIRAEHIQIGCMNLYSKGKKTRRIYFPGKFCGEVLVQLVLRGVQTGFISTNRRGHQITSRGISSQLKVLAKHYRIRPDTVYPHSFRHRFVKNPLVKFNDISLLVDLMRHESIEATRIYLIRPSDEQRMLIDRIVT